jgi:hypothetical protein
MILGNMVGRCSDALLILYMRDHKRVIPCEVRCEGHKHVKCVILHDVQHKGHITHPTKLFIYFLFIYMILVHECFERLTVLKDQLLLTNFMTAESQRLLLGYKPHIFSFSLVSALLTLDYDTLGLQIKGESPDGAPQILSSE